MNLSRTEVARRQRAKRRRKLIAVNMLLIAAIGATVIWNLASSDADKRAAVDEIAQGSAPGSPNGGIGPGENNGPDADPERNDHPESGQNDEALPETEPAGDGTVRFAFAGDIYLGGNVGILLEKNGYDYPYQHVKEILQQADIAAANLETSVTSSDLEKPNLKTYEFRSDPKALPEFKNAGFDVVSLANNHSMDFGPEGLRDTMRHLKDHAIQYVGAGENRAEAFEPVYFDKNGVKVAVLGFSRVIPIPVEWDWKAGEDRIGLADTYNHTYPVQVIEAAKKEADIVVVLVHWGNELDEEPDPTKQVDLGRRYIDAGADLVIGSHPHVLQGFEYYKGRWIAYSLGNFIFTKSSNPATYETGLLEAKCEKTGECSLQISPYRVDTPQPVPMDEEKGKVLLERLNQLSVGASVDERGRVTPLPSE